MVDSIANLVAKIKMSSAILYIIVGGILVLWPNMSIRLVCYIIGASFLYKGITGAIGYKSYGSYASRFSLELVLSIVYILAGLVFIFGYQFFLSLFPVMLGLFLIVDSVQTISYALNLKTQGYEQYNFSLIRGVLVLIVGIVIFFNPFSTITLTLRFIGFILLIDGMSELVSGYRISKWMNR